mmetsp:Transcript_108029/g.344962  ORF Transcript_108029/g.344962 Transcript_108029/m.344962 type:complete len:600 (+) Transcript_108029:1877-3676(+)
MAANVGFDDNALNPSAQPAAEKSPQPLRPVCLGPPRAPHAQHCANGPRQGRVERPCVAAVEAPECACGEALGDLLEHRGRRRFQLPLLLAAARRGRACEACSRHRGRRSCGIAGGCAPCALGAHKGCGGGAGGSRGRDFEDLGTGGEGEEEQAPRGRRGLLVALGGGPGRRRRPRRRRRRGGRERQGGGHGGRERAEHRGQGLRGHTGLRRRQCRQTQQGLLQTHQRCDARTALLAPPGSIAQRSRDLGDERPEAPQHRPREPRAIGDRGLRARGPELRHRRPRPQPRGRRRHVVVLLGPACLVDCLLARPYQSALSCPSTRQVPPTSHLTWHDDPHKQLRGTTAGIARARPLLVVVVVGGAPGRRCSEQGHPRAHRAPRLQACEGITSSLLGAAGLALCSAPALARGEAQQRQDDPPLEPPLPTLGAGACRGRGARAVAPPLLAQRQPMHRGRRIRLQRGRLGVFATGGGSGRGDFQEVGREALETDAHSLDQPDSVALRLAERGWHLPGSDPAAQRAERRQQPVRGAPAQQVAGAIQDLKGLEHALSEGRQRQLHHLHPSQHMLKQGRHPPLRRWLVPGIGRFQLDQHGFPHLGCLR